MGNNDIKNINFLKTQQSKDRKAVYREKKRVKILELLPPPPLRKKQWSVIYVTFKFSFIRSPLGKMKRCSLEFFIYDSLLILTIVFSYFAEIASRTVDQNVVGNI